MHALTAIRFAMLLVFVGSFTIGTKAEFSLYNG